MASSRRLRWKAAQRSRCATRPRAYGGSWGDDGNIIAALNNRRGLSRVPSGGGTPVPVTKLNSGEVTHRWPQVLPGSQAVLFTAAAQQASYDDANIDVISLKTGERKTIQRGGFSARYLADATGSNGTGHLIYLHADHSFRRALRPRPPGLHRRASAHSGGCQQHSGSGRGFCVRGAPLGRELSSTSPGRDHGRRGRFPG